MSSLWHHRHRRRHHHHYTTSTVTVVGTLSSFGRWSLVVPLSFGRSVGRSVVRRSSFVVRRSSFVVRRSSFGRSSLVVRRWSLVVRRWSFVVRRSSFVVRRSSFVVRSFVRSFVAVSLPFIRQFGSLVWSMGITAKLPSHAIYHFVYRLAFRRKNNHITCTVDWEIPH